MGPVLVKQGALTATLSENKIRIADATLATDDATLAVNGELGLDAKNTGNLDYRLRMTDVSPWLALVKRKGSGAIELSSRARGNPADLQTQGVVRLSGLEIEGTVVKAGNISFALRGSQEEFFPRGVVTAQLTDIAAGLNLQRLNATAKLSRQAVPSIQLDLDAQDLLERKHAVSGTVDLAPDALILRGEPGFPHRTGRHVEVIASGDGDQAQQCFYIVDQLSMKNGDRELALYGRFAVAGNQDLTLTIDRLPLGLADRLFSATTEGDRTARCACPGHGVSRCAGNRRFGKAHRNDGRRTSLRRCDCRPGLSRQARDSATAGAPGRCSRAQCQRHAAAQLELEQRLSRRFCRRLGSPEYKAPG